MRKKTALMLAASAFAAVLTSVAAPQAQADPGLGADCSVLHPIASNAIGTLTPWQSESPDRATADRASYVAQLRAQESRLGTARGRADLQGWIDAVQSAKSAADAPMLLGALNKLQADCPA